VVENNAIPGFDMAALRAQSQVEISRMLQEI